MVVELGVDICFLEEDHYMVLKAFSLRRKAVRKKMDINFPEIRNSELYQQSAKEFFKTFDPTSYGLCSIAETSRSPNALLFWKLESLRCFSIYFFWLVTKCFTIF